MVRAHILFQREKSFPGVFCTYSPVSDFSRQNNLCIPAWLKITEYLFYESPTSHSLDMHCPCVYLLPYPLIENIEKILPRRMSIYSTKNYFLTSSDLCILACLKITACLLHRMHLRLAQYSCRTSAYEVQRRTINILNPALKQTRLPIIKNSDEFQGLRNWSQWRQAIGIRGHISMKGGWSFPDACRKRKVWG